MDNILILEDEDVMPKKKNQVLFNGIGFASDSHYLCRVYGKGDGKTHEIFLTGGQWIDGTSFIKVVGDFEWDEFVEFINKVEALKNKKKV